MTHELKVLSYLFPDLESGVKTFEVRRNDRDYQVGDTLILKEWGFGGYGMTDHDLTQTFTGKQVERTVTYILPGGKFGIDEEYVVMAIK